MLQKVLEVVTAINSQHKVIVTRLTALEQAAADRDAPPGPGRRRAHSQLDERSDAALWLVVSGTALTSSRPCFFP
jgi:hypothetical protein